MMGTVGRRKKHLGQGALALALLLVASLCSTGSYADEIATDTATGSSTAWKDVKSSHGHFTVMMPGTVNKSMEESSSHRAVTYVSTPDNGETTFIVQYTTYGSDYISKRSRTRILKEAVNRAVNLSMGKVTSMRPLELNGNDAIEFEFDAYKRSASHTAPDQPRDLKGKGRAIWANETEYVLLGETTANGSHADCEKFLNSFEFLYYGFDKPSGKSPEQPSGQSTQQPSGQP